MDETLVLINDCESRLKKLNMWERDFIHDIKELYLSGRKLSLAQLDTLDKLWEKATS